MCSSDLVMNVMIMAVYERIREIGTILALGTPPQRILWLFLCEGLLLGLAGTVAGVLLAIGSVELIAAIGPSFDFGQQQGLVLTPAQPWTDMVSVSILVILIAIVASLQPAWKASRMDPITALRHV